MATASFSLTPQQSSNALFQAWGSAVDGTFTTFGWVRTSDTGQINWATVPFPTVISTAQGYSIFRMNDSLQSTYPVFIKMEYGGSANGAANPAMWITIGTGSDGSGNITGVLKSRLQFNSYSTGAAAQCYFSGSADRYCCNLWLNGSNSWNHFHISIERTKDASGTTTGTGLLFFSQTNVNVVAPIINSHYIPFSGTVPSSYNSWNCNIPGTELPATGGSYKNTAAPFAVKCWTPGESAPATNFFLYLNSDFTYGNTYNISLFDGAITGTYLFLQANTPASIFGTSYTHRGYNGSAMSIAMRYE